MMPGLRHLRRWKMTMMMLTPRTKMQEQKHLTACQTSRRRMAKFQRPYSMISRAMWLRSRSQDEHLGATWEQSYVRKYVRACFLQSFLHLQSSHFSSKKLLVAGAFTTSSKKPPQSLLGMLVRIPGSGICSVSSEAATSTCSP